MIILLQNCNINKTAKKIDWGTLKLNINNEKERKWKRRFFPFEKINDRRKDKEKKISNSESVWNIIFHFKPILYHIYYLWSLKSDLNASIHLLFSEKHKFPFLFSLKNLSFKRAFFSAFVREMDIFMSFGACELSWTKLNGSIVKLLIRVISSKLLTSNWATYFQQIKVSKPC